MLENYAEKYSVSDNNSISGFIRFIDKISASIDNLEQANQISDSANVVRIMTMHSSKGLEFPVCILADCQKEFNRADINNKLVIHPSIGIGLKRRDIKTLREFDTLSHSAVVLAMEKSLKSEELRILYVAMTRAKERLICVMSFDDVATKLNSLSAKILSGNFMNSFAVYNCSSFADWILMTALRHPDSHTLRERAGIDSSVIINADFKLKIAVEKTNGIIDDKISELQEVQVNDELLRTVEDRLSYKYKYAPLGEVTAKRAASHLGRLY
jgi:ATP-dependent helicase/nuclease subunit A